MKRPALFQPIVTLAALIAVAHLSSRTGRFNRSAFLSRRKLVELGGLALTALLTSGWGSRSSARTSTGSTISDLVSCVLSPEQTEGPYYIAREKVRRDITEH